MFLYSYVRTYILGALRNDGTDIGLGMYYSVPKKKKNDFFFYFVFLESNVTTLQKPSEQLESFVPYHTLIL